MPADLHAEVEKVRAWLTTNRWVDQYDHWWSDGGVVSALQVFLARVEPKDWSVDDVTDLLYVLEQSSTDYIAELVSQSELMALAIARHSLASGGVASDDIAEQLKHCIHHRDEAEALLMEFMTDGHERTRRVALLSLAEMQSGAVPALAAAAWDTGGKYPRMGALLHSRLLARSSSRRTFCEPKTTDESIWSHWLVSTSMSWRKKFRLR